MSRIKWKTDLCCNPIFMHRFQIQRIFFHSLCIYSFQHFFTIFGTSPSFSHAFIPYFGTEFWWKKWCQCLMWMWDKKYFSSSTNSVASPRQNIWVILIKKKKFFNSFSSKNFWSMYGQIYFGIIQVIRKFLNTNESSKS